MAVEIDNGHPHRRPRVAQDRLRFRMNPATVIGMIGGILLVGAAIAFGSADVVVFLNIPGLMIVVGGTVAATLISYPLGEFLRVFKIFFIVLRNERLYARDDVDEIIRVAGLLSSGQTPKVEDELPKIKSPFLRTGVRLVSDGVAFSDIQELLEWRIQRMQARERAEAGIFRAMGAYAPAFGLLGTLMGLVNMLRNLNSGSIEQIGTDLALALITTFYGVLLANLIFLPVAAKLEGRTDERTAVLAMAMEGVRLLHEQRGPAYVRETLNSFLARQDDELAGTMNGFQRGPIS